MFHRLLTILPLGDGQNFLIIIRWHRFCTKSETEQLQSSKRSLLMCNYTYGASRSKPSLNNPLVPHVHIQESIKWMDVILFFSLKVNTVPPKKDLLFLDQSPKVDYLNFSSALKWILSPQRNIFFLLISLLKWITLAPFAFFRDPILYLLLEEHFSLYPTCSYT